LSTHPLNKSHFKAKITHTLLLLLFAIAVYTNTRDGCVILIAMVFSVFF